VLDVLFGLPVFQPAARPAEGEKAMIDATRKPLKTADLEQT